MTAVLTKERVEKVKTDFTFYGDADPKDAVEVCESHEALRDVLKRVLAASAWDDPGTGEKKNIAEWLEDEALRKEAEAAVKE